MENKFGQNFSVGHLTFFCDSVEKKKVHELLSLWKSKIIEIQNGESAYIPLHWTSNVDNFNCIRLLKALKQEEKISLYSIDVVDPLDDPNDHDYWLFTFSGPFIVPGVRLGESFLGEVSMCELCACQ